MKLPAQLFDIVEVGWDDSAAQEPEWIKEISVEAHMIRSVGFLVYCKRDYVVIAQDLDENGQHNGRTQIPRAMVKRMTVLRKKD